MKLSTTSMDVELNNEGILVIIPPSGFKGPETLEHAMENIETFNAFPELEVKAMLAYLPAHYVNAAATRYYKQHRPNVPCALIEDSPIKKMIGNFMLSLNRADAPVRMFKDVELATNWLREEISSRENPHLQAV